jgi:probable dihydroxyacetone kinase regulator
MITDRAGIIRPTFYYHFQDKYELMEWILEEDIISKMNILLEQHMEREAIIMLFRCLHAEKQYYRKAFEVTGQNGFEDVMGHWMEELLLKEIRTRPIKLSHGQMLSNEIFAKYYSIALISFIKIWLGEGKDDTTLDNMVDAYQFLISHSIFDVLDLNERK